MGALGPYVFAFAALLLGVARPWAGLFVLVTLLPFNGFIVAVLRVYLGVPDEARIALAAWHDALLIGIVIAAAARMLRDRAVFIGLVEISAGLVLGLGLVYVVLSPFTLTAIYAYRTYYEPVVLMLAILALSRVSPPSRPYRQMLAVAIVAPGVVAALFTWWQVYVGGFLFLDMYYHPDGATLSPAYTATFIHQPRGIGTFHGPNEFAAYLSMVATVLVTPGVLRLAGFMRGWALALVGLALLLSFSRSGWLATLVAVSLIVLMVRDRLGGLDATRRLLMSRAFAIRHGLTIVAAAVLVLLVLSSSGAPAFIIGTTTGTEPSAEGRGPSAAQAVRIMKASPLGLGLGTAGPKSARFGEPGREPVLMSEMWYLAYGLQVGIPGLAALAVLVIAIARRLWLSRDRPWSKLALACGAGLGTAAFFIPIVEDPSVLTPLFVIVGVALAGAPTSRGRWWALPRAKAPAPPAGHEAVTE